MPKEFNTTVVGKALAHESAAHHADGSARYIDDLPEIAGTLHLAPGYAAQTCGCITTCDLEAVRTAPGVIRVLIAGDIPGVNDCSPGAGDDPILADGRVDFHGQVIFAVLAKTRDQARRAAKRAKIEIASEHPVVDVQEAVQKGLDVLSPFEFASGAPERVIAKSSHSLDNSLQIGGQEHFYLEGQIAYAVPADDNALHVHSSTQHPAEVQHIIARMLKRSEASITVECRRMGGGFGGKESQASQWAALCALAAHLTGKPAKMRLDRDDDMIMTGKRHDMLVKYRAGYDDDGRLEAVEADFLSRCGISADLSLGVNDRTLFHADNCYFYPHARLTSIRAKTNTVSNTAFRGFGGPQGMVFAERLMDEIAIKMDIDPLELRKRNLYAPARDLTPYGMPVEEHIIADLLGELEASSDYQHRRDYITAFNAANPVLRKGIALTPVKFGIAFTLKHLNQAGALVHVYTDGSVLLNHGGTEMGQGLNTKINQIVAEEFGLDMDKVRASAANTAKVPNATPTAASSGSDLNGRAAKRAARTIKDRMIDVAAARYSAGKSQIRFADNRVFIGGDSVSFAELAHICWLERVSLSATGFFATPGITWDREKKTGRPFLYFSWGAACSEVTIDTLTGEMRLDRVDILHDVGKSLNPAIDIGQIEGGFVQGLGWLTSEELVWSDDGRLLTHAPSTYKIPTAHDIPADFKVTLWQTEGNPERVIYRSKAVGEPPVMLAISVFSAITHAIASLKPGHMPPLDAPATPEAIMKAVNALRAEP